MQFRVRVDGAMHYINLQCAHIGVETGKDDLAGTSIVEDLGQYGVNDYVTVIVGLQAILQLARFLRQRKFELIKSHSK